MITRGIVFDKNADKLIVQATDDQIQMFAVGAAVTVKPKTSGGFVPVGQIYYHNEPWPTSGGFVPVGQIYYHNEPWPNSANDPTSAEAFSEVIRSDPFVYDRHGRKIGRIVRSTIHYDNIERRLSSGVVDYLPGRRTIELVVTAP